MKKVKKSLRVYVILQINSDNTTDLCGCYTDYDIAEKICNRLNRIYTQEYFIHTSLLNYDYQKNKQL